MEFYAVGAVCRVIALPPLCTADYLRTLIGIVGVGAGMGFDIDNVAGALVIMQQGQRIALNTPVFLERFIHYGYAEI